MMNVILCKFAFDSKLMSGIVVIDTYLRVYTITHNTLIHVIRKIQLVTYILLKLIMVYVTPSA